MRMGCFTTKLNARLHKFPSLVSNASCFYKHLRENSPLQLQSSLHDGTAILYTLPRGGKRFSSPFLSNFYLLYALSIAKILDAMGRKIDPEERARRLQKKGFNPDKGSLRRERYKARLRYCQISMARVSGWYCQSNGAKEDDIFNQETIKHFIIYMATGVEGQKDGKPMDSGELDAHIPINRERHERNYVTLIHFQNLLRQLWENDWHIFQFPIYRVYLSCLLKVCIYSSGRVGEFVESSARTGSNRGLFVEKDITFLVIRNHKGMPELIFTPRRDAKGGYWLASSLNPVLEPLAICLARGLFRDYKTADKIFAINPPPSSSCIELVLRTPPNQLFKKESCSGEENLHVNSNHPKIQQSPFYKSFTSQGLIGRTIKSNWLLKHLSLLGRRSGYNRLTIHDFRAEALMVADANGYSQSDMLKFVCFICNEWIIGRVAFESHCRHHLDYPNTISIQALVVTERLEPFLTQASFANHMRGHYRAFDGISPLECGSLHYPNVVFTSVLDLQCHYHDVHYIPIPKAPACCERKRGDHPTMTSRPHPERKFNNITPEIFKLELTGSPRKRQRYMGRRSTSSLQDTSDSGYKLSDSS
ncbi:conserved hypothetical protein [Microsporum canis CBS 113480]|uniref:Uncharacterized protein n=1 Tax=Arthroderma otae (strain ATCC MYA-4605 / CBS 113480) TaxID=554155 RepID=C5FRQ3_ARTOC|nr:conserved hypothetical protein [Microsporum canis CBS 113480]EEQ32556.1 conserved hypothetical protein [Microsporum canis CBS 113480]